MTVYVDNAAILYKGKLRHHLTADSLAELHGFAAKISVKRCWYHKAKLHPHYDITDGQRDAALAAGAQAVTPRELLPIARKLVAKVGRSC